MREILFRGKRVDNGEWVEGHLVIRDKGLENEKSYIVVSTIGANKNSIINNMLATAFEVIPSTVGQYTGLTDKNGTRIFEGDIVEYKGERYVIKYLEKYARFVSTKPNTVFAVFSCENAEGIGNVHDNPELLGDKESG